MAKLMSVINAVRSVLQQITSQFAYCALYVAATTSPTTSCRFSASTRVYIKDSNSNAMAQGLRLVALVIGLQLLASHVMCRGEESESSTFELSGPIGPSDLPVSRLTPPATGWKFADYSAVEGTPVVDTRNGVVEVDVTHKPIKGVTPAMVQWLYSNLHKTVKLPASLAAQYGTPTASLFQLLHPVDHISLTLASDNQDARIVPGTTLNWMEMPLSGCTTTNEPINMWSCPTGPSRKGFTQSDDVARYAGRFYTKVSNTVIQFDSTGFKTLKTTESILGPLTTSYAGHNWSYKNGFLKPTSTYRVGLVTRAPDGEYHMEVSRRYLDIINGRIKDAFVNGAPNDAREQGYAILLHSIQEWQRLPQWLPAVYAANNKSGAGKRRRY